MGGTDLTDVAPAWTWVMTAWCGGTAVASLFVDLTIVFGALAGVGVVYLLYKWGQYRQSPHERGDDKSRREKEMESEAAGYGGNF